MIEPAHGKKENRTPPRYDHLRGERKSKGREKESPLSTSSNSSSPAKKGRNSQSFNSRKKTDRAGESTYRTFQKQTQSGWDDDSKEQEGLRGRVPRSVKRNVDSFWDVVRKLGFSGAKLADKKKRKQQV